MPGYLSKHKELKATGIDEVIVYSVNDGAVMGAWGKQQNISSAGGFVTLWQDPNSNFTKSLGLVMTHPGPKEVLGPSRCKRFAMVVVNGVVEVLKVAETPDDPAGDNNPDCTLADSMLPLISQASSQVR